MNRYSWKALKMIFRALDSNAAWFVISVFFPMIIKNGHVENIGQFSHKSTLAIGDNDYL